ncbi:MAG: DUF3786 domain-containing protein [Deltaproteobacteria bacterium]|jgi:hypothetical protein|nr:DUF3786 domain-containing protein [Deltaproteobacteria bacterium]
MPNSSSSTPATESYENHPLWEDLRAIPPEKVAERAGATFTLAGDKPVFRVNFLGGIHEINLQERAILAPPGYGAPGYQDAVVLLSYLVASANGLAPGLSEKEVGPWGLPLGDFFFKGPHELAKQPLAEAFGEDPRALFQLAQSLGAEPHHQNAFRWKVLPFVELYCYLEEGDDEFPAEARYNFDSHAHYYLPLDAIFAMVNLVASFLISRKTV